MALGRSENPLGILCPAGTTIEEQMRDQYDLRRTRGTTDECAGKD
jgi:hypothetical protein